MDKRYVGSERRSLPRLKIPLFIFYRSETEGSFVMHKAISQNIGGGGLMFETEKSIPVGSRLYLEIYQPSIKYKDLFFLLSAQAKIIWVYRKKKISKDQGENKYQVGAEFVEIEKEDKDRIAEYVERVNK